VPVLKVSGCRQVGYGEACISRVIYCGSIEVLIPPQECSTDGLDQTLWEFLCEQFCGSASLALPC